MQQRQDAQANNYRTVSGSVSQITTNIPNSPMLVQFASLTDSADGIIDLRPKVPKSLQIAYDYKSPDEYWEDLQHYATSNEYLILNPQKQRKYFEDGASLIQKLEEVENHFHIDSESIQFIEAQLGDGGIDTIERLYNIKKQLAGYITKGKQYRRELDAMLHENTAPTLSKIIHETPRVKGRNSEYYHPSLADRWVICGNNGNFLVVIRFVYRSQIGGFPKITNVENTINLRTMQSINADYDYPDYFIQEIQSLVKKNFRNGFLKFHGLEDKAAQLQQFLSIIS